MFKVEPKEQRLDYAVAHEFSGNVIARFTNIENAGRFISTMAHPTHYRVIGPSELFWFAF